MANFSDFDDERKSEKMVVAAFDFGTTFSGYAFGLNHEFEQDPPKINTYTNWVMGSKLISAKTPTVLLLKPDQTFEAFGYEAEDKYSELAMDKEHDKHYYFRRFKMKLYESGHLKRDTEITEERGKKMNAIKVFSICIEYLKGHFLRQLKNRVTQIVESDIFWVLTVPAIWNDGAKQFMREAAQMAGIDGSRLLISLEPEAASMFCKHLPVDKMVMSNVDFSKSTVKPFGKGTKYMVVDVGGGTVDITVHEVVGLNKLKELNFASGGAWGGTQVDAAYDKFLVKIFGDDVIEQFKKEYMEDFVDLQREFETKKRGITGERSGKQTMKIPVTLTETYEKMKRKTVADAVKSNTEFAGKLTWVSGKLRIDVNIMNGWFDETIDNTIRHMRKLFREPECIGINTILLVGGFAESPLLQEAVRNNFSDKRLIIPEEAGLAVLKGAVLFGHDPLTITARRAKCSYGIRVFREFDAAKHPQSHKSVINGMAKCIDCFAKHVTKGDELEVGKAQLSQRYTPVEPDQISLIFDIYTSTEKDVEYITDPSCTKLGELEVDIGGFGKDRGVTVEMKYGGTELIVEGTDEATKKVKRVEFNFLQ